MTINIVITDSLESVAIVCGQISPETCCRPPPLTVGTGDQVQLFAALQYNCAGHVVYASVPPPMCP